MLSRTSPWGIKTQSLLLNQPGSEGVEFTERKTGMNILEYFPAIHTSCHRKEPRSKSSLTDVTEYKKAQFRAMDKSLMRVWWGTRSPELDDHRSAFFLVHCHVTANSSSVKWVQWTVSSSSSLSFTISGWHINDQIIEHLNDAAGWSAPI